MPRLRKYLSLFILTVLLAGCGGIKNYKQYQAMNDSESFNELMADIPNDSALAFGRLILDADTQNAYTCWLQAEPKNLLEAAFVLGESSVPAITRPGSNLPDEFTSLNHFVLPADVPYRVVLKCKEKRSEDFLEGLGEALTKGQNKDQVYRSEITLLARQPKTRFFFGDIYVQRGKVTKEASERFTALREFLGSGHTYDLKGYHFVFSTEHKDEALSLFNRVNTGAQSLPLAQNGARNITGAKFLR
jgi:hypothetical protein